MSTLYTFVFENLKPLCALGKNLQLCIYEPTRKLYVLKTVDPAARAYYERIAAIEDPHLSKVLFLREQTDGLCVMREYLSGETLAEKLGREGTLPPCVAVTIITQICRGLEALHKNGLVHRDVTPNNIILTSDGNAKIIDYGIARAFDTKKSTDTAILGTPGYAAPEQFGFSQSNARTDIYAAGVLLNVMLTGKMPSECLAGGALGRIVSKCIEIDARQRYADMGELRLALESKLPSGGAADRFFKAVPGLRSPHLPIVILAILLYATAALLSYFHFSTLQPSAPAILLGIGSYLCAAVIPFFCFHNVLHIWDRLPFTKGCTKRTQKTLYFTLGTISLLVGLFLFALPH